MNTRRGPSRGSWHGATFRRVKTKIRKLWTRTRCAVAENRVALLFVLGWLALGAVVVARTTGVSVTEALALATCLRKVPSGPLRLYQSFTEVVVFGVVASLVVTNVTQRQRPERIARALAASARDHVVVVGMSNLGRRVHEIAREADRTVVVVDADARNVEDIVLREEPAVVGDARSRETLEAASVARAKLVVLATDDLETAAVAARVVRELNADCDLVVRCPDEDVGAVLARTYRACAVSTSKLAGEFVLAHATKWRARSVVVLGKSSVGVRVAEALASKRIAHVLADVTDDLAALEAAGVRSADLVVVCDDDLGKNLVRVDRIRELAPRARVICRAFHEEAAKVLERAPFDCVVLSTSRHAANALARAGAFRAVGIEGLAPARPAAPLAEASASG